MTAGESTVCGKHLSRGPIGLGCFLNSIHGIRAMGFGKAPVVTAENLRALIEALLMRRFAE